MPRVHLALLAVGEGWRCRGRGRALVQEAFARTGTERTDLIASDESLDLYRSIKNKENAGFKLYAGNHEEEA